MTLILTLSCDGHRHGQPCRGNHAVGPVDAATAAETVARVQERTTRDGWRPYPMEGQQLGRHLCPSPGHDEEKA